MIELAVSILVAAIVVLIYLRYRNVFCLPFFWAAYFLFQYLGYLQVRANYGGISYAYAAAAFGVFFAGLLAADFLVTYRSRSRRNKDEERRRDNSNSQNPISQPHGQPRGTKVRLLFPVLPLNVGLFVSLLAATFVSVVFFNERGIPILSSSPAMAWIQSTSGVVNRIMTVFGPGCYASLGLVAWAVHRKSGSRAAWAMMYMGLGLGILGQALLASKAAAILIFIWFNIVLFYMNKKRELRKSLLPMVLVVIPVSVAIVMVRLMSVQGYWEAGNIVETYYNRVTIEQAAPGDFIFKYMDRFGPMHGGALRREMARVKDQLTGAPKTAIPSEFVYDLMNDERPTTTGLSAALTLYATGYLEWGLAGMLIYSLLQGLAYGWVHRYLLRQEKVNIVSLLIWGAIINYLMSVAGGGTILVSLESIFLSVVPPMVLLIPFGIFFLLPFARRYRTSVDRRISRVAQG